MAEEFFLDPKMVSVTYFSGAFSIIAFVMIEAVARRCDRSGRGTSFSSCHRCYRDWWARDQGSILIGNIDTMALCMDSADNDIDKSQRGSTDRGKGGSYAGTRGACLLIGNEILSGRTEEKNLMWLARRLRAQGIRLHEAAIIPDVDNVIMTTLNRLRANFDHVFTTGGIGPTHDDITARAVAAAFAVPLVLHKRAEKLLRDHYGKDFNTARRKMAMIPKGARLIDNPISCAPGFSIGNVHVMAGVPAIMQAMARGLLAGFDKGDVWMSSLVSSSLSEGMIAAGLADIQKHYGDDVEIGSYPWMKNAGKGVNIVVSGYDQSVIMAAARDIQKGIMALGGASIITDPSIG